MRRGSAGPRRQSGRRGLRSSSTRERFSSVLLRAADEERGEGLVVSEQPEEAVVAAEEDLELAFQERAAESLLKVGREHKEPLVRWNHYDWQYWDVAQIYVRGGDGGRGCKSFRREKNVPFGGPDGGNGGHGGHVFLECARDTTTLEPLKHKQHYHAKRGINGMGKKLDGKNGEHLVLKVPPGSCIYVRDSYVKGFTAGQSPGKEEFSLYEDIGDRHLVGELTKVGQTLRVARGGLGGRGNLAFKTHHNTAPWICEIGELGLGRWIEVELKMLADIGIIGVPNAGKSSLLSAVTSKEAKIAAYPFTTQVPNVGFHRNDEHGGLTLCDVPGLIEGAHEGRGMGFQFLRHIERCRTLIHVVAGNSENPLRDFDLIQEELQEYNTAVAKKPQVVVVNKCDIPEVQEYLPDLMAALRKRCGHSRVFDISVATRYHVDDLMKRIVKWHKSIVDKDWKASGGVEKEEASLVMNERRLVQLGSSIEPVKHQEPIALDPQAPRGRRLKKGAIEPRVVWDVLEQAWRMKHPEVERVARHTNWDYPDAGARFNRVCKATGMTETLANMGLEDEATVIVGTHRFQYEPGMIGNESRMLIYEMNLDF